jgi:hypothetical protein
LRYSLTFCSQQQVGRAERLVGPWQPSRRVGGMGLSEARAYLQVCLERQHKIQVRVELEARLDLLGPGRVFVQRAEQELEVDGDDVIPAWVELAHGGRGIDPHDQQHKAHQDSRREHRHGTHPPAVQREQQHTSKSRHGQGKGASNPLTPTQKSSRKSHSETHQGSLRLVRGIGEPNSPCKVPRPLRQRAWGERAMVSLSWHGQRTSRAQAEAAGCSGISQQSKGYQKCPTTSWEKRKGVGEGGSTLANGPPPLDTREMTRAL